MEDIIKQMIMSPNSTGEENTTEDIKKPEDDYSEDDIVSLVLKGKTVGEKYRQKLIDKAIKDPNSVKIKIGKGFKTVKEAMEAGDLGEMPSKPDIEELIKDLDPEMQAKFRAMLDPKTTNASKEQLTELGFEDGMGQDFLQQGAEQDPMAALLGGAAPGGAVPEGEIPPELLAGGGN